MWWWGQGSAVRRESSRHSRGFPAPCRALLEPIREICAIGNRHSGHLGSGVADSELIDPVVFVGHIVRPESGTPMAIGRLHPGTQIQQSVGVNLFQFILAKATMSGARVIHIAADEGGVASVQ